MNNVSNQENDLEKNRNIAIGVSMTFIIILLVILLYYIYKKYFKKVKSFKFEPIPYYNGYIIPADDFI